MKQKISDEQFLIERQSGLTLKEIAEKYDMNIRTVEYRSSKLAKQGHQHGNVHVADHIPEGYAVKGTSVMIRGNGEEVVRWVKSDRDREQMQKAMEAAADAFASELPKATPVEEESIEYEEGMLSLYPVFDLHIGALAHKHESGENYNTAIAEQVLGRMFDYAVHKAPRSQKAVLLIGGDFLHSDGLDAVTPASGHVLDQDSRYAKLVYVAIRSIRKAISQLLKKHKLVEVQIIEGNHDQSGMIWLRAAMAAHYEDEERVYVDVSPAIMHKTRFGSVLLGYTHGHTIKKADSRLSTLAADHSKDFGDTKYRYVHSGHFHHQTVTEHTLGIDEVHPALAAKDAYAARGGWRSYRQAAVINYHEDFGEVGRIIYRPGM